jgi:RNA polymerase sigma-70 factor (ECF subfamily)
MKTEKEILELLKFGDENAIRYIFDEYYERLCLYADGIIRNHQAAEDIVEDLFVSVWIHAGNNTINTSIKNYLFKSTFHNCLKYLNKLRAENKSLDQLNYTLKYQESVHPYTSGYPLSNLLVGEIEKKAEDILNSLPDQCRKIYMLNRFEDLNYNEIATRLKITVGTVKTQMSRAFQRFREGLKEYISLVLLIIIFL